MANDIVTGMALNNFLKMHDNKIMRKESTSTDRMTVYGGHLPALRCSISVIKILGQLFLCSLMLAGSYFCTTVPGWPAKLVGWAGLIFFGIGFRIIALQLFRPGAVIILDEVGIHDHRFSFGSIPWGVILSLRLGEIKSSELLCIEVREPGLYLSRLPAYRRLAAQANPRFGFPPITISFSGLSPGIKEVWAYIQKTHPEKIASTRNVGGGKEGGN